MNIQTLYHLIRQNRPLDRTHLNLIQFKKTNYTLPQLAALGAALYLKVQRNSVEEALLQFIADAAPLVKQYLQQFDEASSLLNKVMNHTRITKSEMHSLFQAYLCNEIDDSFMAIWLMTVMNQGLADEEIANLTEIMAHSGRVYDYRNLPELEFRKIVRRYPTGGVSEKIALIMPSLIAAFAEHYPVASHFLVARSLGHTGGTWDKLSSIPGFRFPEQGPETLAILKKYHVAMSVTNADCNPLDNKLYQLRSATGSVASISLISASIASKLLALPADFTLLDVRYGPDVFAQNREQGIALGATIQRLAQQEMACDFVLTEVSQPDGMAIGNKLEVMEALCIMKNDLSHPRWNQQALQKQKNLVINMFKLIMQHIFPDIDLLRLEEEIQHAFTTGRVLNSFKNLLLSHGVKEQDAVAIIQAPEGLIENYVSYAIYAKKSGFLKQINLKELGLFVNFDLITGLNTYTSSEYNGAGVILKVCLGDKITEGAVLCEVIALPDYILNCQEKIETKLKNVFVIG